MYMSRQVISASMKCQPLEGFCEESTYIHFCASAFKMHQVLFLLGPSASFEGWAFVFCPAVHASLSSYITVAVPRSQSFSAQIISSFLYHKQP